MGYDLHITRRQSWSDGDGPEITKEEWLAYVARSSDLESPDPESDYVLWRGESKHEIPWLCWGFGNISTKNPDRALIVKMIQIARDLNARVEGDDGEEYESEDDLPLDMDGPSEIELGISSPAYSESSENIKSVIEEGLYRMSFRGLTFSECWRFGGPLGFPIAVILKIFGKKGPYQWLPPHQAEVACQKSDMSQSALERMQPEIDALRQLGYEDGVFSMLVNQVDPSIRDGGGYVALHPDGRRFMGIGYSHTEVGAGASRVVRKIVAVSGMLLFTDGTSLDVLNHKSYLDDDGLSRKILLKRANTQAISERLDREMWASFRIVRKFSGIQEFRKANQEVTDRIYQGHIVRGLFNKVSREEQFRIMTESSRYSFQNKQF